MKCQLRPRSSSCAALSAASWSRFSPTSVTPSDASRRTSCAGWNLVTTIRRGGVACRPAAATAASILRRTAERFASSWASRGPRASAPVVLARQGLSHGHAPGPRALSPSTPARRSGRCGCCGGRRTGSRPPGCSRRSIRCRRPLLPAGSGRLPAGPGQGCRWTWCTRWQARPRQRRRAGLRGPRSSARRPRAPPRR